MRLHIDKIKDEGLQLEFAEEPDRFPGLTELAESGGCSFPTVIRTRMRAQKAGEMIEVEGEVETLLHLTCDRCLTEFEPPLSASFAATYVRELPRAVEETGEEEVELTAEEMGLNLIQGEEIDLGDLVQEQVLLNLPLHALCRPDCRGLCQHCGADLNRGPCDCSPEPFQGKFAALKNFKVKKK